MLPKRAVAPGNAGCRSRSRRMASLRVCKSPNIAIATAPSQAPPPALRTIPGRYLFTTALVDSQPLMPSHDHRARSVSGDIESSDIGSPHEGDGMSGSANAPGKPGRKKNPNSQAARRDQNRIAQREFRLRKQQRIRDLEASVEILSGGKDEALGHLRKILKDLMHENQVLRDLLRSLSSFIGDGAGGLLPKLGWDLNDFNNFINKAETDSAWESYQRHKQDSSNTAAASASASGSQPITAQKRPSEEDPLVRAKRPRGMSEQNGNGEHTDSFANPMLVPLNSAGQSVGPSGLYPATGRQSHDASILNEFLRNSSNGSPMFMSPSSPANASGSYNPPTSTSVGNSYQGSYMQTPMSVSADGGMGSIPLGGSVSVQQSRVAPTPPNQAVSQEDDTEPKKEDAYKLIHYHLDNYKRNSAYCLPSSLRPTLVQRTVPHESVIDAILHPELRDRMILLRGRFDLVDCLHDYRSAVVIHGDDVLAHSNWEISETWLQQYKFLADQATLMITNRWRRERGESELRLADFQEHPTSV
ncbi:uncharacterized protein FIBRA_03754 [Fibroporia radiculosa]|uniref:BZIP domain-containing protein n=1 Tax=Fibroporia radiculosa TaxID=599839 RepID=J4GNN3_9APHY|nr:uncharacterized protein FIBRA_03754 [Fibroporia radiculosa]CCM01690.1 predicted protein [Fibroporia radiculosa]